MSTKVSLKGATSGQVDLAAPDVAGASVLTLPATTDTVAVQSQAVRQVVRAESGAVATGSTTIPWDDTIPQITEGDQYLSATITPKSASSTLLIFVDMHASIASTAQALGMALFKVGSTDAIAVGTVTCNNQWASSLPLVCSIASGSTSAQTFTVRMGPQGGVGGTVTMNGSAGGRLFGGAMKSSITIMEIGG